MNILIDRYNSENDHTDGLLFIDCEFICYTLEDEYRTKKVYGETRIPDGVYRVSLRTVGGFHNRYSSKYPFHKGMLQIEDVPGFEYILIHTGNTDDDTAGCLLVGSTADKDKGFIGGSVKAYKELYPIVLSALERKEEVIITYKSR
tara:strand:- start:296 stop:733 length:438 start_codon:yes stop_codon:yes gene_type:complete